jgi:hypothetical protein
MKSIENVDNFDPVESNEEMIGECSNLLTKAVSSTILFSIRKTN